MLRSNSPFCRTALVLLFAAASVGAQTSRFNAELDAYERSIDQGRFTDIEGPLIDFVMRNRSVARGFELLGRLRSLQGRWEEARSLSKRALSLDASLIQTKLDLAQIELRLGHAESGLTLLNEITASQLSTANRLKLAQAYAFFGRFRDVLRTISALPPKIRNRDALSLRVLSHLELGEDDQVKTLVAGIAKSAVRSPAIAVKVGEALVATRFNKEAKLLLRPVAGAGPKALDVHLLLARAELFSRNFTEAKKHLAKASAISPGSSEVVFVRAVLLSEQNENEAALDLLEKALTSALDPVPILRQIAMVAMRANRPSRAVDAARMLLQMRADVPEFIYLYGVATLQSGRLVEAEGYLTRYAEVRPQDTRGCVALGLALISQPAKVDAGRSRLEKCLVTDPSSFEAAYQLGVSYRDGGELQRAKEMFERVVKIAPDFPPALRDLGAMSLQAGETSKARSLLEKAVVLAPSDAITHFQLSRLYNLIGEASLAATHFERFRTLKAANDQ